MNLIWIFYHQQKNTEKERKKTHYSHNHHHYQWKTWTFCVCAKARRVCFFWLRVLSIYRMNECQFWWNSNDDGFQIGWMNDDWQSFSFNAKMGNTSFIDILQKHIGPWAVLVVFLMFFRFCLLTNFNRNKCKMDVRKNWKKSFCIIWLKPSFW